MSICETLAINLRFYRFKYQLSQEKFAEILGTTLSYLNQIENNKVDDMKTSTIMKFVENINKYDTKANLTYEDLVNYKEENIIQFSRIDEKK